MRETDVRCYVYFVMPIRPRPKGPSPVKIGFSVNPERRLSEIQTGNPEPLKIGLQLPFDCRRDAEVVERCMHRLAKKKHRRLNGEWFMIYDSLPRFIAQSMKIAEGALRKRLGVDTINPDAERNATEELDLMAIFSSPI